MKKFFILAVLMTAIIGQDAAFARKKDRQGPSCKALVSGYKIKDKFKKDIFPSNVVLKAVRLEKFTRGDSEEDRLNALILLINASARALNVGSGKKDILEKEVIRLAALLGDGTSFEFVYNGDNREEKIYRLEKVMYIPKKGDPIVVDKDITIDEGTELRRKNIIIEISQIATPDNPEADDDSFPVSKRRGKEILKKLVKRRIEIPENGDVLESLIAAAPYLSQADQAAIRPLLNHLPVLRVPLTIHDPVLAEFLKWAKRYPYSTAAERRAVKDRAGLLRLYWKYRIKSTASFLVKRVGVEAGKYVIWGVIGYTAASRGHQAHLPSPMQQWNKIGALAEREKALGNQTIGTYRVQTSDIESLAEAADGVLLKNFVAAFPSGDPLYFVTIYKQSETILISESSSSISMEVQRQSNPALYEALVQLANKAF